MVGGKPTVGDHRFMVYIVQSNQSSKFYDNWLCGGALISQRQVLTAAACLVELTHVYVIAGYRKYVNGRALEYDDCTRERKQRVVATCVPKEYGSSDTNRSRWMTIDIGVAVVEKPYDFNDDTWSYRCSYTPKAIRISYDDNYQKEGIDVVAFGWGADHWRLGTDVLDNNSPQLQEIASLIARKQLCKDKFDGSNIRKVIDRYMICVEGVGNIDGDGNMVSVGSVNNQGCRRMGSNGGNDHGGPLITWIGSEEVLIGVACASIVDGSTSVCRSPSIFTGTYCTGKIVECLTAMSGSEKRRRCAEDIKIEGIDIHDNSVEWERPDY